MDGRSVGKDFKDGVNVRIFDIVYCNVTRGVGAEFCRGVDHEVKMKKV